MITYEIEFEFAAAAVLATLLGLYAARNKYPLLSNIWYISMLFTIFSSAILHIAAITAVTFPYMLPLWSDYVVHIGYLLAYNLTSVSGFLYVTATLYKRPRRRDVIYASCITAIFAVFLITTPFTKLVIYLDENRNYLHGPLFAMFPTISLITVLYFVTIFLKNQRYLSKFQRVSVLVFITVTVVSVGIQLLFPNMVIANFAISLTMIMFFVSLQNPDDLIDKQTECYNAKAFYMSADLFMDKKQPFETVAFSLEGLSYIQEILSVSESGIVARTLSEHLRKGLGDTSVYHLGSTRFAVFSDEKHSAESLAANVQKLFAEPVCINNIEVTITPYICTIHYPDFVSSTEDIRDTIEYTFRSMNGSEGTVTAATAEAIEAKKRENRIVSIIRNAVAHGGFEVYYQPIFDTKSKSFVCAEALIRLRDEELGFISPEEFIPLAESHGLIMYVGEFVFRTVCGFVKNSGVKKLGVKFIEVNLSVLQCVNDSLADKFLAIMEEYGTAPENFNFEITETAGLADFDTLLKNMNKFIEHMVTFSVDDYGTGFSTANYLITLPAETVKIDKSILWPAMKDPDAMIILKHTVDMLRSLKKKIVVEGVENEEMAKLLTEMGVDYLQGYYFSKPIPADEYISFLEKNASAPVK